MLFLSEQPYLVRLELDRDEYGRATMTKTFFARSAAEARELARLECGLTWVEALRKLTVKRSIALMSSNWVGNKLHGEHGG